MAVLGLKGSVTFNLEEIRIIVGTVSTFVLESSQTYKEAG